MQSKWNHLAIAALTAICGIPALGQTQVWDTTENSVGTQTTTESAQGTFNGKVVQDTEVADDFQVFGSVTRIISYATNTCFQTVTGVRVRFYEWTDAGPGVLQSEYVLAADDPGFVYFAPCPSILDVTLPSAFTASGWHFVSVQLMVDGGFEYWQPLEADEGPLNNSTVYSRDNLAGGVWEVDSDWSGDGLSDMQFELFGFAAPFIAQISPPSVTRSNRIVITGSAFGNDPQAVTVFVDGQPAIVTQALGSEIHAYVPETASLGIVDVQVVNDQGPGNAMPLTIVPRLPDGRVLWKFQTDGIPAWFQYIGVGPDTRVYISDQVGLYALAASGELLWFVPGIGSGRPIDFGPDGTIYTGGPFSSAPLIVALSPAGEIIWQFDGPDTRFGAPLMSGPNVGPDGNIYAVQDTSLEPIEGLGAFSIDSKANLRWSNLGDPLLVDFTASNMAIKFSADRLFAGMEDVDSPHTPVWVFTFDGQQLWFSGDVGTFGGNAPVVDPFGRLILRQGQTGIRAISPDGVLEWFTYHPGQPNFMRRPAVDSLGNIYTGDLIGIELWSLDPRGDTRWVLPAQEGGLSGGVGVSPDDAVIVVSGSVGENHWVRGYGTDAGELLWQVDLLPENGMAQMTINVEPAFQAAGDVAYVSTHFAGDVNNYGWLYAIATADPPLRGSPGDLNNDGIIGPADLAELLASWGPCGSSQCPADIDGDGSVGTADLAELLASWS